MKKIYLLIALMLTFSLISSAQNWLIYDGSVLPSETDGGGDTLDVTSEKDISLGAGMIREIILDANIPGNKVLKYFHPDGKLTFRHVFDAAYTDSTFTIVARLKGSGDPAYDRVMDIRWDNGNAETRDELRIYNEGRIKLEKAGVSVDVDFDVNEWHIYRIQVIGDSATIFVDEDPTPFSTGTSTTSSTEQSFRFGDGSGDAIGGYVDWIVLDSTGAYTPVTGPLPVALTGLAGTELVEWHVYDGDVLPDRNNPEFEPSNTAGDTYTNRIIDDPDQTGNSLLELISSPAASNFMWKHNFPVDPTPDITMVARVKAVSDTVDRPMEFDFQQGGFRERLYINIDSTFELKQAGLKGDLPDGINILDWHTYRITKTVDQLAFYLDENPVAVAEVVTATTSSENYFRFGDGNGSYEIGGFVDWVAWTTSGIFAPGVIGMPETDPFSSDASLYSLASDVGALDPVFNPDTLSYDLVVPAGTASVTLSAVANYDPVATLSGDGEIVSIPGAAIITVTAENGATRDYTVNIITVGLSSDATLSELTASVGTLDPVFAPETVTYDLEVPYGTTSVTLTATPNDANATASGDGEISTVPGTVVITVTADNDETLDYTVNITVAPASTDAALSGLVTTVGTLDPVFNPETVTYDLELPDGTTSVTLTATPNDDNATVSGDGEITVIPGTAVITVTAEDGTTTRDYTVNITIATAISNNKEEFFSMYPNPAGDYLKLTLRNKVSGIKLYSITGEKISEFIPEGKIFTINTHGLQSGIYFIEVKDGENSVIRKFVKQ
ncbi:MAG: cadherin-like beta sandwich domain-containing protein [Bacteroidales bacterium]|nr:cadherin-like beta sandwich domain-containing protein [Bacteroidales bacterium]